MKFFAQNCVMCQSKASDGLEGLRLEVGTPKVTKTGSSGMPH